VDLGEITGTLFEIASNVHVAQDYYKLTFNLDGSPVPRPGQFYQVRCSSSTDPLFRRPFSAHRVVGAGGREAVEILYRIAGTGTEWLRRRGSGETLDILGPLGNGFVIDDGTGPVVLVARGVGVASVYMVGEEVRRKNGERSIVILTGARTGERIFYEAECERLGDVFVYTDDGSRGFKGTAPDLLARLAEEKIVPEGSRLYACGPARMLKDLAGLLDRISVDGQGALEERMGCGFGACLACACPLKPGGIVKNAQWSKPSLHWSADGTRVYSLICKDGPVYDLGEVDWDEWTA
jgi:dihydroorotate dehydrogenase electron transfer subunit